MREGFLWSASTSAFQIEGAYLENGKGLSTVDTRNVPEGITDTKIASDHYHNYKEDIKLMKELGLNTYRFSISWPRIFPDLTGEANEKGIKFYNDLINELIKNGIEPLVTIYHFDLPQVLVDEFDGWLNRETINYYEKYAITLFESFGDRVKKWISINEQLMVMYSKDFNGIRNVDGDEYLKAAYQMSYHMTLAEKKVMKACKKIIPDAIIGPSYPFQVIHPYSVNTEDIIAAFDTEEILNYYLLDLCVNGKISKLNDKYLKEKGIYPKTEEGDNEILHSSKPDFIGVNYYFPLAAEYPKEEANKNLPLFWQSTKFNIKNSSVLPTFEWMPHGVDPASLRLALKKLQSRYGLPTIITENGLAYSDVLDEKNEVNDDYRIDYIKTHLQECKKAIEEGVDLMGYSPWSFLDSLSGRQGFSKRYGLVYVNRTEDNLKDLGRIPKKSFYWYKDVIKTNGNSL